MYCPFDKHNCKRLCKFFDCYKDECLFKLALEKYIDEKPQDIEPIVPEAPTSKWDFYYTM